MLISTKLPNPFCETRVSKLVFITIHCVQHFYHRMQGYSSLRFYSRNVINYESDLPLNDETSQTTERNLYCPYSLFPATVNLFLSLLNH